MRITKALVIMLTGLLILISNVTRAGNLPDGFFIDHGYTFFQVESLSEPIDGKQTDKGWKLEPYIRIYGNAPEHSSIKLVLRKGKHVISERRTTTTIYGKGDPHLSFSVGNTAAGTMQPHFKINGGIQGLLPAAQGTGEFEVDISYIDGASKKEYAVHTYTLNVGKVDKLDVVGGKFLARPPEYFVSRHQEILSTILTPWAGYQYGIGGPTYRLLWNASPLKQGDSPTSDSAGTAFFRCTVDGKAIKLGNKENPQYGNLKGLDGTQTANPSKQRFIHLVHTDRNALEYQSGTAYREPLIFYSYLTKLPFEDTYDSYPSEGNKNMIISHTTLENHPGRWQCEWLDNGTLIRTFAWNVKDGKLQPHAEQEEGLTLNPGAILVDTIIPDGGAAFDGRIVPDAVKAGGFYGWQWQSSEMKKLAKKVPEVGKPHPTPSAPEFVAKPDKGPSSQELAKAKRKADSAAASAKREADSKAHKEAMDAEREKSNADGEARKADIAQQVADAQEQALAESKAAVQSAMDQINDASDSMKNARKNAVIHSPMHLLGRLALAVLLVLSGLLLSGTIISDKISAIKVVIETLTPLATTIGLATLGVAIVDMVFDLITLRPIIGDGIPQIVALAAGGLLGRETIEKLVSHEKLKSLLDILNTQQTILAFSAITLGILHLLIGGSTLI